MCDGYLLFYILTSHLCLVPSQASAWPQGQPPLTPANPPHCNTLPTVVSKRMQVIRPRSPTQHRPQPQDSSVCVLGLKSNVYACERPSASCLLQVLALSEQKQDEKDTGPSSNKHISSCQIYAPLLQSRLKMMRRKPPSVLPHIRAHMTKYVWLPPPQILPIPTRYQEREQTQAKPQTH